MTKKAIYDVEPVEDFEEPEEWGQDLVATCHGWQVVLKEGADTWVIETHDDYDTATERAAILNGEGDE